MKPNIRPGVGRLFRLALNRRADADRDAEQEIDFHLQEREQQLIARGMNAQAARIESLRRFGNVETAKSELHSTSVAAHRKLALREHVLDLLQDVRFAARSLRRTPSFAAIAIACLALGIGANVAIFAVVDGVLLKPLPFMNATRLVHVWTNGSVPPGIFEFVERNSHSYSQLAGAESGREMSLTGTHGAVRVIAAQTTSHFFDVLGATPTLGRTFVASENGLLAPSVAVISYAMWQTYFGGDSQIVGQSVLVDGVNRTIVGVMPQSFRFSSGNVQMWMPVRFDPSNASYWWSTYLVMIGRLKPGATIAGARAEAAVILPQARKGFPMRMPDAWGKDVDVAALQSSMTSGVRPTLLLLYAAVGLVLLIACVNVASLFISRTLSRAREIAVRTALGSGRLRILQLLSLEGLLIAIVGAAIGLLLAWIGVRALVSWLPADTPRIGEIGIGIRAIAMTILLTLTTALVSGVLPVLRSTRKEFASALRSDSRTGATSGAIRTSAALAIAQIALAVTLISGAGLLVKSLWQLRNVDLGFSTTHVLTATVPLPSFADDTAARAPGFFDAVLERSRALPGVTAVAIASSLPFGDGTQSSAMEVEAHPTRPGEVPPLPQFIAVSPAYFSALQIPLRNGRLLNDADREHSLHVGVIDETGARALWPDRNAIGERIRFVWNQDWITIVGVVGDVKRDSMSSTTEPTLYVPSRQSYARLMHVVLRTPSPPLLIAQQLKHALAQIDATVPLGEVRELDVIVRGSAAHEQFVAIVLAAFAAVALLLGAVGIYGVISASVARRTREIGVRMALGATSSQVLRQTLKESVVLSGGGVVIGLAGAMAFSTLLRSLLFGVGIVDVTVLIVVTALLAFVSIGAGLAPALRASRIDPLTAIRAE